MTDPAQPALSPTVPAYGGGSLADVMPATLGALGVAYRPTGPGDRSPEHAHLVTLPETSAVCVLLIDGLGWSALRCEAALAPFLSSLVTAPHSRVITSVFPTTTPIALTSLGTGLAPGEHGITGLYLRLGDHGLVNTLAMPAETDMRALQPLPTVFETADAAGVAVTRVGPAAFDGAGLTEAALRGGCYARAEGMGERVAAVAAAVRRGPSSLTYVYVGELDATGHRRGRDSPAWRAELRHLDRLSEQLADVLPGGTTLVVTSDHGMVDVPLEHRWDVATTPALGEGVAAIAGDLRAVNVHARPGAGEDVLSCWRETLGAAFWVGTGEHAAAVGLYGPVVTDAARHRIGDVVAAATADHAIVDSRLVPPPVLSLVGLHGSVTEDELLVPLLVHHT